jgi:hypothetical protein
MEGELHVAGELEGELHAAGAPSRQRAALLVRRQCMLTCSISHTVMVVRHQDVIHRLALRAVRSSLMTGMRVGQSPHLVRAGVQVQCLVQQQLGCLEVVHDQGSLGLVPQLHKSKAASGRYMLV